MKLDQIEINAHKCIEIIYKKQDIEKIEKIVCFIDEKHIPFLSGTDRSIVLQRLGNNTVALYDNIQIIGHIIDNTAVPKYTFLGYLDENIISSKDICEKTYGNAYHIVEKDPVAFSKKYKISIKFGNNFKNRKKYEKFYTYLVPDEFIHKIKVGQYAVTDSLTIGEVVKINVEDTLFDNWQRYSPIVMVLDEYVDYKKIINTRLELLSEILTEYCNDILNRRAYIENADIFEIIKEYDSTSSSVKIDYSEDLHLSHFYNYISEELIVRYFFHFSNGEITKYHVIPCLETRYDYPEHSKFVNWLFEKIIFC